MRILCSFVAVALLAATAPAQTGDKARKKGDEPQFDRTGSKPDEPSTRRETTPEEALTQALPLITTWPAEAGEGALRALIARGPNEIVPLLRARLQGGSVLERSAAARGLCLLGDRESFATIAKLFGDPRQRRRFNPLLESLHDLDPDAASALALDFVESEDAALRGAATALLKRRGTPELLATLKQRMLATRSDAVRLDLFTLLEGMKDRELPELALERFLGDPSPQLASRVTQLLSAQDAPEIRNELVRLARGNRERRGLHAALALAIAEQRTGTPLLPNDLFDAFLPSLRTSDLLLRATSCVVCGLIGYRSEEHKDATQERVLPALADVVVHGRFFGDFELCFRTSVRTLELLTGERLGTSVPAWRDYFAAHADAPLLGRRELKGFVLEEDAPDALVTLARVDDAGRIAPQVALCGPAAYVAVSLGQRPGQVALGGAEMRALLTGLESDGLLSAELPRAFETPPPGGLVLTVQARGRERSVALAPDDPRARVFADRIRAAAEPVAWQLLLEPGDGYAKAFAEERAWFDTHPDAAARRSRLIDLALAQIATRAAAAPAATDPAFQVLGSLAALDQSIRADQIDALARLLSRLAPGDARSRRIFDLLIGTRRADAVDRVLEALLPRGTSAVPWMADALAASGRPVEAVGDVRPLVRLAALSALERESAVALSDDVLIGLASADPDPRVRTKALALLARSGSEQASSTLLALAREGEPRSRADALRLLGLVGREDALAELIAAAHGEDGMLAAGAIEGLSRRGDDAAAAALEGLVRERGPGEAAGRLAMTAIKGLPRPLALARLRKLQAEGEPVLAREAAYGLSDLGEMSAVPALLADLEDPRLLRRAQTLLTYLFCRDFGTETWRFRSLYETQPAATHADHFLAALQEGGAVRADAEDLNDPAAVPLLVAAIEDSRWYVRRSALEFLEAVTGRSLGSLPVDASREQIADLSQRWREATSTQARGDEQR